MARTIREREERILKRWQDLVTQTLPEANRLTLRDLRNDLPHVLDRMTEALESEQPRPAREFLQLSPKHGEVRYHQDFDLGELLMEYHLFRQAILEELTEGLGRPLELEESLAINLGVDVAQHRAALAFSNHQAKELQAGVESQSKYLSFLSHDLRGGLNSVLLMVEVLRQDLSARPEFAESLQDLDLMKRSILETVSTMDRFLHAEKLRKGMFQVQLAELDVGDFVSGMIHQFEHQAAQKGVKLRSDVPADCVVQSDRELLSLIFQNLLGNAVKYSSNGTVRVKVQQCDSGRQGEIQASVTDQGPGIPPDQLETMFQPFTRGQTHGQKGSGLGLNIARQAAELLGARLWAESQPGEGATFHLRLPVNPA